jgi:hypothetical protein
VQIPEGLVALLSDDADRIDHHVHVAQAWSPDARLDVATKIHVDARRPRRRR